MIGQTKWGLGGLALIIFAIAIHIFDVKVRLSGFYYPSTYLATIGLAYALLALLAAGLLRGEEGNFFDRLLRMGHGADFGGRFWRYLIVSFFAFCIPFVNLIVYLLPEPPGIPTRVIMAAVLIWAPLWPIYIILKEPGWIPRLGGLIYLGAWIVIIMLSISPTLQLQYPNVEIPGVMPGMTTGILIQKTVTGAQQAISLFKIQAKSLTQEVHDAVVFAQTGIDQKQARVEAAKAKTPGVRLYNIKTPVTKFHTTEPMTVYATLKAEALETPVKVKIECDAASAVEHGKLFPKDEFYIETSEIQDIDCIFTKEQVERLGKGPHIVTLKTLFNFETLSYLETFFMTQETLRELQKKGEDPLAGYPQPEAITSKGPVNLNIKTPTAPIPAEQDKKIAVAITIFNTGGGTIKEINSLYIYVPKGFTLFKEIETHEIYERINCEDLPEEETRICDPETTDIYQVKDFSVQYKNIRTAREFRMYLQMDDYDKIIGEAPVKPGSFHASMKYQYELKQELPISITEPGLLI